MKSYSDNQRIVSAPISDRKLQALVGHRFRVFYTLGDVHPFRLPHTLSVQGKFNGLPFYGAQYNRKGLHLVPAFKPLDELLCRMKRCYLKHSTLILITNFGYPYALELRHLSDIEPCQIEEMLLSDLYYVRKLGNALYRRGNINASR